MSAKEKQVITRTPISYYGGKQKLAKKIISMIPAHVLYAEPFFGGGAVFFAKEKSVVEVINDRNLEVTNFYEQTKVNFNALNEMVQNTIHSRTAHAKAALIYNHPDLFNETERAWAFWVQTNMSFGCAIGGGFGYDLEGKTAIKINNKKLRFDSALKERLSLVTVENSDALKVIQSRDKSTSFFYCDPPYPESHQGHYGGYSIDDFESLLKVLSKIKGKFLLSSYNYELLEKYTKKFNWKNEKIEMTLSASKVKDGTRKKKIEVLTWNY